MELELKNFSHVRIDFFKNHNCIKQIKAKNYKKDLQGLVKKFLYATQVKDYDYYQILVI